MSKIIGDTRVFASLFPLPSESLIRDYVPLGERGARTVFQLGPRMPDKKPRLLTVNESWQPYIQPENPGLHMNNTISIASIVNDLSYHWRRGLMGAPDGLGPAIWPCGTHDEPLSEPTSAEIQRESDRQHQYFTFLYQDAQRLAFQHKFVEINGIHRMAAKELGKTDEWVPTENIGGAMACPYCTKMMPVVAFKCPNCLEWVKEPTAEMQKALHWQERGIVTGPPSAPGAWKAPIQKSA